MTIAELNSKPPEQLEAEFDTYLSSLIVESEKTTEIDTWIKEYDMDHDIFDRQDKQVGEGDNTRTIEVAKLGVPFQKKIVNTATSFLFGEPVKLIKNNSEDIFDDVYDSFTEAWKQAKLHYHNRKLARRLFVETEVAELFYIRAYDENPAKQVEEEEDEQTSPDATKKGKTIKKLKVKLLCRKNGDKIYPVWDSMGDMIGFIRTYQAEIEKEGQEEMVKVEKAEIYTDQYNYVCTKGENWIVKRYDNPFGKIPVIYYEQEESEWADVQSLIDRVETMISINADTNDYFGSPAIIAKGELASAPDKGEVGKMFEIKPSIVEGKATFGDLSYLTWDQAPEATKMEFEILKDLIYSQTSTPDLSFNNVKGTTNLSGIALKFMFMDALLKALDKQEVFGEGLERRVTLMKKMLSVANVDKNMLDLDISIEFGSVLPENIEELINVLTTATGGASIMSKETAVKQNPLVDDPEAEIEALDKEEQKQAAIPESYGFPTN